MDDPAYNQARARVEAKLGFYRHTLIYVLVNLLLLGINLSESPELPVGKVARLGLGHRPAGAWFEHLHAAMVPWTEGAND